MLFVAKTKYKLVYQFYIPFKLPFYSPVAQWHNCPLVGFLLLMCLEKFLCALNVLSCVILLLLGEDFSFLKEALHFFIVSLPPHMSPALSPAYILGELELFSILFGVPFTYFLRSQLLTLNKNIPQHICMA